MSYFFYILFGVLPSIIWLLFYLRKDSHPEPNTMILKIFFFGAVSAGAAALLEILFFKGTDLLKPFLNNKIIIALNIFLGVALVEEAIKYLVIKINVLKNKNFDEPTDVMLYMIIAALGFAAAENTLILWFQTAPFYFLETVSFSLIRFLGATFLHALASGIVGYFTAISFLKKRARFFYTLAGLWIAAGLHGLYNFSIMYIRGSQKFILPAFMLLGMAIFVSLAFKKLKRLKSICRIPLNHAEQNVEPRRDFPRSSA